MGRYYDPATGQFPSVDPAVAETGQAYAYTGDDPVNEVDPLGLCTDPQGTYLVPGACHWTSQSWVFQTEATIQAQGHSGGGFSITQGLEGVVDYGAGIVNSVVSTVTLNHVHVSTPFCVPDSSLAYGLGNIEGLLLSVAAGGEVLDAATGLLDGVSGGTILSSASRAISESGVAQSTFRIAPIAATGIGTSIAANGLESEFERTASDPNNPSLTRSAAAVDAKVIQIFDPLSIWHDEWEIFSGGE